MQDRCSGMAWRKALRDSSDFAGDFRLDLDMPGCFLRDASPEAKRFFKDIDSLAARDLAGTFSDCVCAIYDAPNAYLESFCPVELANSALNGQHLDTIQGQNIKHRIGPGILAFQDRTCAGSVSHDAIPYKLFLTRSERHPDDLSAIRLWLSPFPSQFHLHIQNQHSHKRNRLLDAPTHARVWLWVGSNVNASAHTVVNEEIEPTTVVGDSVAPGDLLANVRLFLDHYLQAVQRYAPRSAWEAAVGQHGTGIADHIPPSVRYILTQGESQVAARDAVLKLWSNPLHAPLLVSEIASRLAEYLTTTNLEDCFTNSVDRARYFTLFTSLRELRAMDNYIGSVPLPATYPEIKTLVRQWQDGELN